MQPDGLTNDHHARASDNRQWQNARETAPRKAELVKLRYFLGCTISEAAAILGIAPATAEEDWTYARAWLRREGVIHRDIKHGNVLVTMYDDKPVPKVIDFGVARAIEQRLTEKTLFTQNGMFVGTFEYMSPEQAEMNAFGVDRCQWADGTGWSSISVIAKPAP